jgi:predicted short-subunit dehydrogenase-like oxidoreductase (DUF2520 family)
VATHLAARFAKAGHTILFIYSTRPANARRLARKVRAKATQNISDTLQADTVIIAVHDDAIAEVVNKLPASDCLVLHTSGAEPMALLRKKFKNCGVLYPVQTFSIHSPAPLHIPFCLEAANASSLTALKKLARSLSRDIQVMNSRKRKQVHLAAVFVNNFSNHLLAIAEELLKQEHLKLKLLQPLLEETISKTGKQSPSKIQTGPAARGDKQTMQEHIRMLKKHKDFLAIYKALSESIRNL